MRTLKDVIEKAKTVNKKRVVVVGAEDKEALKAVSAAYDEGFVEPVLVGNKEIIEENLKELGKEFDIIDAKTEEEAAEQGVRLVSSGAADIVMKGLIKTSKLLKAVLNKEWGLRTGSVLSHVAIVETDALDSLKLVTDGGMIIKPTLDQKVAIINNAVELAHSMGIENPKVALLAAVEVVNPDMPETMDAAIITQMNKRGQIKGCTVDGPLALDNALSEMAAKIKKIKSDVAGHADILVVPDIHAGNVLGKAAVYLANGKIAGLVLGAKAPIVIVSRADTAESKLASLALAVLKSEK
ncbi:phosphate butyryltransferase [Marinitoga sp. 1135]|uniref:Phosphotransacetylase n=1 Tax=Marinitoga piezophila (strain DSM 14283 / JCM 11233 / KA3) TaxID=443254 RepID=H2J3Q1_MARPK|nr:MULTISPECIES: bifunctional enoyl-CoA hydratase/phosphate acetyltransferase [Marinitoga]AEX85793.1 phosphotransacetylase [Marinitoga piezophila KA3]APT76234.1 phosphate butyryltransferase [Marinitoga sp. 1137]NUU95994.1 phosphate butyryltransferase [Marinitoga sp. 1135]NUU97906.1 phosphate butyryltransferase [Marinitoga sp. 1138]